jgi:hypothetical protein
MAPLAPTRYAVRISIKYCLNLLTREQIFDPNSIISTILVQGYILYPFEILCSSPKVSLQTVRTYMANCLSNRPIELNNLLNYFQPIT